MHTPRDPDLRAIQGRPHQPAYGMGLGVILLEEDYPGFPGDVRNASAYPFPIQYALARGVDIHTLVVEGDKSPCLEPILHAAQELEDLGCRAVVAECGYFAWFQREIAAHLRVPVFTSSLMQVPLAQRSLGEDQVVGILVAQAKHIADRHLEAVGIDLKSNFVLAGAMDAGRCTQFDQLWTRGKRTSPPEAQYAKAREEFLAQARAFYAAHEDMGAMVLECTGFPPFARALQREIDIPLYSYGTLLDYAYSVVAHRDYYGYV